MILAVYGICFCVQVVQLADATLYSENEQLDSLCRRMLKLPKPTFDHLNQIIASQLAHLCLPVRKLLNENMRRAIRTTVLF